MAFIQPISSLRVLSDTLIARGPVLFWGYAADTTGAWSFVLRDGANAGAQEVVRVGDATGGMAPLSLARPVLFRNGLFCDVGGGLTGVTIFYEPIREEMLGERPEEAAAVETE
jgi:hypothetical protein